MPGMQIAISGHYLSTHLLIANKGDPDDTTTEVRS